MVTALLRGLEDGQLPLLVDVLGVRRAEEAVGV